MQWPGVRATAGRPGRPAVYNALRTVPPELSAKRRRAGRKGAEARWGRSQAGQHARPLANRLTNPLNEDGYERLRSAARQPVAGQSEGGPGGWYRIANQADDDVAVIDIYDEIGGWGIWADEFVASLRDVTASRIDLHINSPGGSVFDGIAIYNALLDHPSAVVAYIDGLAASAASFIAQAGDRVVMARNAEMMIHDASGFAYGPASIMEEMRDLLDKVSDNIASIYNERAGRGGQKTWRERMRAETWYSGDEALAAGLADEVKSAGKRKMPEPADGWDLSVYAYPGRSEAPDPDLDEPAATANGAGPANINITLNVEGLTGTTDGEADDQPVNKSAPVHHTDVEDGEWDANENLGRVDWPISPAEANRLAAGYREDQVEDDEVTRGAVYLPHHFVSGDGAVGAASVEGVRNALSRLPQTEGLSDEERDAAERHLQAHLDDYGDDEDETDDVADGGPADEWAGLVAQLVDDHGDTEFARLVEAL